MTKFRQYAQLAILGLGFSSCMALPYIHFKLYDLITGVMDVSNQQLGMFLTVYTVVAMCCYIPTGAITDRVPAKLLMTFALILQALAHIIVILSPNNTGGLIAWAVSGVIMPLFWVPMVKAVRESGSAKEQGKMFGCFYAATGVFSTLIGLTGAKLVAFHPESLGLAFNNLMYVQAAFCLVAAAGVHFVVKKHPEATSSNEEQAAISLSGIKEALKLRAVQLMIVLIFCGYGIYLCIGYLTPYTTNVLGASIAMGGVLGTIRTYGLRIFTGPLSGVIADKIGSTAKVLIGAFGFVAITTVVVLMLPPETSNTLIVALTLLFGAVGLVIYNLMLSCIEETQIPPEKTGLAVAVISLIGYTPDALFPPVFGYLLDTYGNTGYTYIFYGAIGLCIAGVLICGAILKRKEVPIAESVPDYAQEVV